MIIVQLRDETCLEQQESFIWLRPQRAMVTTSYYQVVKWNLSQSLLARYIDDSSSTYSSLHTFFCLISCNYPGVSFLILRCYRVLVFRRMSLKWTAQIDLIDRMNEQCAKRVKQEEKYISNVSWWCYRLDSLCLVQAGLCRFLVIRTSNCAQIIILLSFQIDKLTKSVRRNTEEKR